MASPRWYHKLPMAWVKDMACPCCGVLYIETKVLETLRAVCERYGHMVYVTSGYRCILHNDSLAGASKTSQHMAGLALDLAPLPMDTVEEFAASLDELERACVATKSITFIKRYATHIHIDLRPGARVAEGEVAEA